ncbi:MAG: hypothetical protein ACTS7I_00395 [Candidatus Hodgkinia cicadicola]
MLTPVRDLVLTFYLSLKNQGWFNRIDRTTFRTKSSFAETKPLPSFYKISH